MKTIEKKITLPGRQPNLLAKDGRRMEDFPTRSETIISQVALNTNTQYAGFLHAKSLHGALRVSVHRKKTEHAQKHTYLGTWFDNVIL